MKSNLPIILTIWLGISLLPSCSDEDTKTLCDQIVVVDSDLHMNGPSDPVQIMDARIDGDCLVINFGASGCSGENWDITLFDASAVAESFPVQRFIRLSLDNREDCLAFFSRERSFDLKPIQLSEYDTIILNLEDYDQQLRYEY